jgi:hypothetical protein
MEPHGYRVGANEAWWTELPKDETELETMAAAARRHIEPWLSAVFQAEHLNLLVGSGFASAVSYLAKVTATGMDFDELGTELDGRIKEEATRSAKAMGRGAPNIEDQFRVAFAILDGLALLGDDREKKLRTALQTRMSTFLRSLLKMEADIESADDEHWPKALSALQSFLLSFASRAASRERLHVFTTNYDRLIEKGCDLAGIRVIDRFVGMLEPTFRASRMDVDYHYNPPGIRGEPRYMEGVLRLTKLHGSLDWHLTQRPRQLVRRGIPFGAPEDSPLVPTEPLDTVMIYPNAVKDVETTEYPYAELFRDMAAATSRPNAVLVTYGYGFGDDHINRVLLDMLTIPSTHLVIIVYEPEERLKKFLNQAARSAQISLLVGKHFADLSNLVERYLPKPALDMITGRMAELLKHRSFHKDDNQTAPPDKAPDGAFDEFGMGAHDQ